MNRDKLQILLDRAKSKVAQGTAPAGQLASLPWNQSVGMSKDLERILSAPRREWTEEAAQELADKMTPLLRKEGGTQTLRPVQAMALHDLAVANGLICTARVGGGKAQPDFEPILTESGWMKIGDTCVGDRVYGSDGRLHEVTGVFPQGERQVFRVKFSDGTYALSDIDHLWTFQVTLRKWETRTLREWLEVPMFRKASGEKVEHRINRLHLPMVKPIEYPEANLPLDPYTLGALLGDGGMTQTAINFTTMDEDIKEKMILPDTVKFVRTTHQGSAKVTQYNLTRGTQSRGNYRNPLNAIIRKLGLSGKSSHTKFIPTEYLFASVAQRLEILRGICDTHRTCARAGRVNILLASADLRNDVATLVESLGGSATRSGKNIVYRGEKRTHYRLNFALPQEMCPFYTKRKKDKFLKDVAVRQRKNPKRAVVGIEEYGKFPCTCISVDAEDQLYVTRFHVLTHNTLSALMSPYMLESVRPLLLIPANLKKKTKRDIRLYREHWEIAEFIRIESYEKLAGKKHVGFWEEYRPDLIICDEAHKLRNTGTAVVKRIKRYRSDIRPNTPLALFSGTLTKRSLKDYWHLVRWTFPYETCPMPHSYEELDMWASALDADVSELNRVEPGALIKLCREDEKELFREEPVKAARRAFHRRLRETVGFVTTHGAYTGASLQIDAWRFEPPPEVQAVIAKMEKDWETPDGWPISDGIGMAAHKMQMALGFHYYWDPRPPQEWLKRRKAFCKAVRQILRYNNRNLDTEAQAIDAIDAGHYHRHEEVLAAWREIKDTFKPNTKATWHSDFAVDQAISWMDEHHGIVWVGHTEFGRRLSEKSGVPYYAGEGFDEAGNFIEDHPAQTPLIASIQANREGRNLQHRWNTNLVVHPPTSGEWWEQLLGRTHREEQPEDTVYCHIFFSVLEHVTAFHRACKDAEYIEETQGPQKLLYADVLVPTFEELEKEISAE